MQYHFKKVKSSVIGIIIAILLLCGCESVVQSSGLNDGSNLLTTKDFIDVSLSAPEGSGAIRTLTIHYMDNGKKESAMLDEIARVDSKGYDDEAKEQTLNESDFNQDGIIEIIVYQEFEFPDIDLAHVEIPLWPTIYEYDLSKGFIVASAKYKDYYKTYAEKTESELEDAKDMSDPAKLALKRLIYAAEKIADGSFIPSNPYSHDYHNNAFYTDVYELVKNIEPSSTTGDLSESVPTEREMDSLKSPYTRNFCFLI